MTPNWELTVPPEACDMSLPGAPNCAWVKRLKISARKSKPNRSVIANRLINEKSVLTKFGPDAGVRFAVPSCPGVAGAKQLVLNQWLIVRDPLFGSQTWSGRLTGRKLYSKLTPD